MSETKLTKHSQATGKSRHYDVGNICFMENILNREMTLEFWDTSFPPFFHPFFCFFTYSFKCFFVVVFVFYFGREGHCGTEPEFCVSFVKELGVSDLVALCKVTPS